MARPRRETDYTALYVRIPSEEAEKLHRAADVLRTPISSNRLRAASKRSTVS